MGYMLRYHEGFSRVASWGRSGFLGRVFSVRGHMSTCLTPEAQRRIGARHRGGVFYDLAGHMLDQVVWMLGRPHTVTSFLHGDGEAAPGCVDNGVAVCEFDGALAGIDIAAMETRPMARRFEVYGTRGSAILLEPFEPGDRLRLCLDEARDGFREGEQVLQMRNRSRGACYAAELADFISVIADGCPPSRDLAHELLVQETLLRAAGELRA